MIPVTGYSSRKVAVLGLGRSGLATARALLAGGAIPLLWDDSPEARAAAEAAGFTLTDLTKATALEGVSGLITSPGIPHLYPAPHKLIARAWEAGVPVDNDIGLFFRSFATSEYSRTAIHDGLVADRIGLTSAAVVKVWAATPEAAISSSMGENRNMSGSFHFSLLDGAV